MNSWECGVCGYVHKEEKPPEKCPVCEAPEKMFKQMTADAKEVEKPEPSAEIEKPETAADAEKPEMAADVGKPETAPVQEKVAEKRWRCTVCGYIHTGTELPEKCPVCDAPKKMFVEIDADGKALTEVQGEELDPAMASGTGKGQKQSLSLFDKFANVSLKHHLHPITVHFPNGVIPVIVVFLGLSVYFNILPLETAAHYNLIFVLVMLPMVLLTGFIEWQKRYKGIKSAIFIVKIICALIVLALSSVLVFWRLIEPGVAAEGSPSRYIYLGIAVALLAVAGLAGYLGGKLLYGRSG